MSFDNAESMASSTTAESRQTRKQAKAASQTQVQSIEPEKVNVNIKEIFENEEFAQFITKIVRTAVREEMR